MRPPQAGYPGGSRVVYDAVGGGVIGELVGSYRLEEALGEGTFGKVYRGVHKHMPSIAVAVKVVHPSLARDPIFVESIQRESKILHGLHHPGIVGFRDLVLEDNVVAMVLELLEGEDLYDHLQGRTLVASRIGDVLAGVLEPLAYAHGRGVLHRDIKPNNIFVCTDGVVKLLDFGISKAAEGTVATRTGTITGTLDYMGAEAFDGRLDPRSDVYAAGLVAWEMVTGQPACPDSSPLHKMKWHHEIGAPDLWEHDLELPSWLRDVVHALTRPDPDERPADGAAALELLRELRGGTRAEPVRERGRKPSNTVTVKQDGANADAPAQTPTPEEASREAPPTIDVDAEPLASPPANEGQRRGSSPLVFGGVLGASAVLGLGGGVIFGLVLGSVL